MIGYFRLIDSEVILHTAQGHYIGVVSAAGEGFIQLKENAEIYPHGEVGLQTVYQMLARWRGAPELIFNTPVNVNMDTILDFVILDFQYFEPN